MWATYVPILVFLRLSVLDLGPMNATDVRRASSLNAPTLEAGHNKPQTDSAYNILILQTE